MSRFLRQHDSAMLAVTLVTVSAFAFQTGCKGDIQIGYVVNEKACIENPDSYICVENDIGQPDRSLQVLDAKGAKYSELYDALITASDFIEVPFKSIETAISYRVDLAKDPKCEKVISSSIVDQSPVNIELIDDGEYFSCVHADLSEQTYILVQKNHSY